MSYALFATSLSGLILVLANVEIRAAKMDKGSKSTLLRRSRLEKGTTFLLAGPLAGIVSGQFALLVTHWMPASEITRMASAVLLFPLLWGVAATALCMRPRSMRHVFLWLAAALLFSAALYG